LLLPPPWIVKGIELANKSISYDWDSSEEVAFEKITLFHGRSIAEVPILQRTWATLRACWGMRPAAYFFCHYEQPATFICAMILRLCGYRVFVMNDSKFDDYQRYFFREMIKGFFIHLSGRIGFGLSCQRLYAFSWRCRIEDPTQL